MEGFFALSAEVEACGNSIAYSYPADYDSEWSTSLRKKIRDDDHAERNIDPRV
jgi:hypothetical protein